MVAEVYWKSATAFCSLPAAVMAAPILATFSPCCWFFVRAPASIARPPNVSPMSPALFAESDMLLFLLPKGRIRPPLEVSWVST